MRRRCASGFWLSLAAGTLLLSPLSPVRAQFSEDNMGYNWKVADDVNLIFYLGARNGGAQEVTAKAAADLVQDGEVSILRSERPLRSDSGKTIVFERKAKEKPGTLLLNDGWVCGELDGVTISNYLAFRLSRFGPGAVLSWIDAPLDAEPVAIADIASRRGGNGRYPAVPVTCSGWKISSSDGPTLEVHYSTPVQISISSLTILNSPALEFRVAYSPLGTAAPGTQTMVARYTPLSNLSAENRR